MSVEKLNDLRRKILAEEVVTPEEVAEAIELLAPSRLEAAKVEPKKPRASSKPVVNLDDLLEPTNDKQEKAS